MTARIIIGAVALAGISACGVLSTIVAQGMVSRVNERLPEGARLSPGWWSFFKLQRLSAEYRRLFPEGRLLRRLHLTLAIAGACFAAVARAMGFVEGFAS